MTLHRQLIIFTFALFLLLFAGTWYAKLESTRTFLINQLESHAQDTATSLALSISPHAASNDMVAIEGMMNAVFDRGYYQIISFTDTRKKPLVELQLPVKIENVPSWFVQWIPLKTPEATADVMAGWKQAGAIYVKSHPGYAYKTLWDDVLRMTLWFGACAVFVLIAGAAGLRVLLKPLVQIELQADALCRKEYRTQEPVPRTKEFRRVVEAMNRMTRKVKEMFEEQVSQAEGMRERAYHDALTGLGNRRYFEGQISACLDQQDQPRRGVVILVRVQNLETLNRQKGFQAGDALLQRVATVLQESVREYGHGVLARLTGGDFGFFLPDVDTGEAELIAGAVATGLNQLAPEQLSLDDGIGVIGGAAFDGTVTLSRLLAEADLALGAAMLKGGNAWEVRTVSEESGKQQPLGQQQWRELLVKALAERRITLYGQPVTRNADGRTMHLEIFLKIIQEDGSLLNAAMFIPLAERLKLVAAIDRLVIEELKALDIRRFGVDGIAVNLSATSLLDETFRPWLCDTLRKLPAGAPRLTFEFSEFAAVQHLPLLREFSEAVRACGHGIGLDHYGQSFSKLGYLHSLRPEYVKIDRAYTGEIRDGENDSRFYIGSLCSVAHSIDVGVIAEGVETEQQATILKGLSLDGVQGHFIGRPEPLLSLAKPA
jgi:diguanylate cyclase (GGDEF)-like protein